MNTKHAPATPLPWRHVAAPERGHYDRAHVVSDHYNKGDIVSGQGSVTAGGICGPDGSRELSTQNAAYIAHAANAYPRLVEALKRATGCCEDNKADGNLNKSYRLMVAGEGRALLRELGEDR